MFIIAEKRFYCIISFTEEEAPAIRHPHTPFRKTAASPYALPQ
jgi:hypothetical protein